MRPNTNRPFLTSPAAQLNHAITQNHLVLSEANTMWWIQFEILLSYNRAVIAQTSSRLAQLVSWLGVWWSFNRMNSDKKKHQFVAIRRHGTPDSCWDQRNSWILNNEEAWWDILVSVDQHCLSLWDLKTLSGDSWMETGNTSDWQRRMSKLPVDTLMFSLTIRQEEETIVSKKLISI